jgi:hypothetical protein
MNGSRSIKKSAQIIFASVCLVYCFALYAGELDKIIDTGEKRTDEGKAAQQKIDKLSNAAEDLSSQYKQAVKVHDGLKVYNSLLQTQINNQGQQFADIKNSISEVALIERQIVPLMVRMIDSLDKFIQLDIPFLLDERNERVAGLISMVERSDVTVAEKFRRVLEAFQIEIDYGKTLLAYRGALDINGLEREVEFLRVGRIALLYQTLDRQETGAWDNQQKAWIQLPSGQYRLATAKALRIAKKQIAPDLLIVPISSNGSTQ